MEDGVKVFIFAFNKKRKIMTTLEVKNDALIVIKGNKQKIDFSFVDDIFGKLDDKEADDMRKHCHINFAFEGNTN